MREQIMSTVEAREVRERAAGAAPSAKSYVRALLSAEGCHPGGPLVEAWEELAQEVRQAASGPVARGSGGEVRAVAALALSDRALGLLDDAALVAMVDSGLADATVLSRADGVVAGAPAWRRSFGGPLRDLPPRALRPGISVWLALSADARMEVLRCSQHLPADADPEACGLPFLDLRVPPGHALLLEGGVVHRPAPAGSVWLALDFVRPWIKPEVLLAAALAPERLARLGEQGRRWCGAQLGLPTSVDEFLAIEEAALSSGVGLAKGSGI
jgi:hypothetical protein